MKTLKFGIVLILAFVLMLPCAIAEKAQEELSLTIDDAAFYTSWKGKSAESYQWYVIDVTISNWSVTTYALSESIHCRLIGEGSYVIDAVPDFTVSSVDPFTRISGRFAFKVPDLIVNGYGGPLTLEMNIDGHLTTRVVIDAPPLEVESQSPTGNKQLTVAVELSDPPDKHMIKNEPGYEWLVYKVTLTNPDSSRYEMRAPVAYSLVYKNSYSFVGESGPGPSFIDAFVSVSDTVVFKVPNLVVTAKNDELLLRVEANGSCFDYILPQELIVAY